VTVVVGRTSPPLLGAFCRCVGDVRPTTLNLAFGSFVALALVVGLVASPARGEPQPLACVAASYGVTHFVVPAERQTYVVDARGLPSDLARDVVLADVQAGFDTWNSAVNDCLLGDISDLAFVGLGETAVAASLARGVRDGVNVVAFRSFGGEWPAPSNGAWAYIDADEDGVVREWDLEFDADLVWGTTTVPRGYDIWNAVAHEVGHLAGLGHLRGGCGEVSDPIDEERTMHPCIRPGQTSKRTLALGDWRGLLAKRGVPV
jgi:hypothetical protein